MKKLLAILGASALLFVTGCDNAAGTDPAKEPTVDVGTVEDLPATGATAAPEDEAESLAIVDDVLSSVMNLVPSDDDEMSMLSGARATETQTQPVNFVSEDGKIALVGSAKNTMTVPDDDWQPNANVWYNNIILMRSEVNLLGTLAEADVTGEDGESYIVSGKFGLIEDANTNLDMRFNYVQGMEEPTYDMNMDMSFALQYGLALSVLRDDGVGARFMITFSGSAGFTDFDLETMSLDMEAVLEDLASQSATLTAYDDTGNVINSQPIPLTDLPGLGGLLGVRRVAEPDDSPMPMDPS